ncbi:hypothetical protein Mapa_013723 [Marchantia paleacea]|nr:hypothetical protein Mapa_013723 [Marchantia paleacea]
MVASTMIGVAGLLPEIASSPAMEMGKSSPPSSSYIRSTCGTNRALSPKLYLWWIINMIHQRYPTLDNSFVHACTSIDIFSECLMALVTSLPFFTRWSRVTHFLLSAMDGPTFPCAPLSPVLLVLAAGCSSSLESDHATRRGNTRSKFASTLYSTLHFLRRKGCA